MAERVPRTWEAAPMSKVTSRRSPPCRSPRQAAELSPREQAVATASAGPVVQGGVRLERVVGRPAAALEPRLPAGRRPPRHREKYRGLRVVRDGALLPDPVAGGPTGVSSPRRTAACSTSRSTRISRSNRLAVPLVRRGRREGANRTAIWRARYEGGRLHRWARDLPRDARQGGARAIPADACCSCRTGRCCSPSATDSTTRPLRRTSVRTSARSCA